MQQADLHFTNLTNAGLRGANLARAVLKGVVFESDHQSLQDGSEEVIVARLDRWLNWARLRQIGQLPLFGVSYLALIASVAWINGTDFLNRWLPRWADWLQAVARSTPWIDETFKLPIQPFIPVPSRMIEVVFASLFLVVGTTIYRLACPDRVQEFSETQWVEEHGRARLQYFAESFRRKWAQWPTLTFTVLGGAWGLKLVGDRLWQALRYLAAVAAQEAL